MSVGQRAWLLGLDKLSRLCRCSSDQASQKHWHVFFESVCPSQPIYIGVEVNKQETSSYFSNALMYRHQTWYIDSLPLLEAMQKNINHFTKSIIDKNTLIIYPILVCLNVVIAIYAWNMVHASTRTQTFQNTQDRFHASFHSGMCHLNSVTQCKCKLQSDSCN